MFKKVVQVLVSVPSKTRQTMLYFFHIEKNWIEYRYKNINAFFLLL